MQIDKNKFQVFILVSWVNLPFSFFARHAWFVVNKQGVISRWEVLFRKTGHFTSWGHLHKDYLPPFTGIEIIPFCRKFLWPGKLLGFVEGDAAKRTMEFLGNSPKTYPYCHKYSFFGPNSNTYAQWVLRNFPEFQVKLPWNAVGKNFKLS